MRSLPDYLAQAGFEGFAPRLFGEKSKRRMIAEDFAAALRLAQAAREAAGG